MCRCCEFQVFIVNLKLWHNFLHIYKLMFFHYLLLFLLQIVFSDIPRNFIFLNYTSDS